MSRYTIGVCGRVGSGKTTFAKVLSELLSAKYINADKYGKDILVSHKKEIISLFSEDITDKEGEISTAKLSHLVFSNEKDLKHYEKLVHPVMVENIEKELASLNGFVVLEAAILYRMRLERVCDKVVFVYSDEEDIIERVIKRNKTDESFVRSVLDKQKDVKDYDKLADIIVNNASNEKELLEKANIIAGECRECMTLETTTKPKKI